MRTLTSFLFVNMAAADLLVTLGVFPMSIALPYTNWRWLSGVAGHITCKAVFFALHVSITASILSLTFVSVDRYLGVVFPLRNFPTFRSAKVLTNAIWFSSMTSMIPVAVLWKIEPGKQEGMYQCRAAFEDVFGDFKKGMMGFYVYLFLISYLIPLLVISVLYGTVCRELWRRKMPGMISRETEQLREAVKRKIVRTLVLVTAAFALCWLPSQTYHLILAFNYDLHLSLPRYVMYVCFWCGQANSALNPWLYMLLTDKFRMALREIFLGRYSTTRTRSFRTQCSTRYASVRDTSSRRLKNPHKKGELLLKEQWKETPI